MIVLGLALTALLGWLSLPHRLNLGLVSGLALGFLAASFGLSVELFVFSVVGLPLNAVLAITPWIVFAVWSTMRGRPMPSIQVTAGAVLALGVTSIVMALWLPMERSMTLNSQSWDAWAIWLFKAKAFYLDGNISDYLSRSVEFIGQPGYPLLTPLYSTWLYEWSDTLADHGAKLTSPLYFLATIGASWWIIGRLAGPTTAGITASLVALTPMVQRTAFDWAGYADTALSAYFVVAAGFLVLWIRDAEIIDLAAGSLAATAAAWTKNEGQVFLAIFMAIAVATLVSRRRGTVSWVWVLAPPTLLIGTWFAVRATHGVEAAGFVPGAGFDLGLFTTAAGTMASKALSPNGFALAFPLFLATCSIAMVGRVSLARWAPSTLVLAHIAAALLAYSTGRNEISWWLETSADRVLAQIAPLAIVAAAAVLAPWLETAFDDGASATIEPSTEKIGPASRIRRNKHNRDSR